jgi:hypothetical protein
MHDDVSLLPRPTTLSSVPIDFDDDETLARLSAVYNEFVSSAGLDGAIARDELYWSSWIREPAEGFAS